METLQQPGVQFIAALQHALPGADGVMRALSFLGVAGFFQILVPLVYWCVDSRVGIRLALLLVLNSEVNSLAKLVFHQPRPYWLDLAVGRGAEASYGVPSGHAQGAVAVWFYLASQARRRWAWVAAGVLTFLISLSRVYLGVHFPHDIVVGWFLGALVLLGFLRCCGRIPGWLEAATPAWLAALSVMLAAAVALVALAMLATLGGMPDPSAWAAAAKDARDFSGAARAAGVLTGVLIGYGLQERTVRFDAGGPLETRALRLAVGLLTLAAILLGSGVLQPHAGAAGHLVRALRYAVTMLWAAFGAPWLFVKLNLAGTRDDHNAVGV